MTTTLDSSPDLATQLRVLLVEDDMEDALLLRRLLGRGPLGNAQTKHCTSLALAREALQQGSFDIVFLDLGLPDGDGLTHLPVILSHGAPVVVLTGNEDSELAIAAVREGAQDYLPKNDLSPHALSRSVHHAIQRHRLRQQLMAAHQREQALKDDVLSHVSHELRTPLTAVSAFTSILRDGLAGPLSDKQGEYLAIIERNAAQLKRLIGDLMDVARIGNGKLTLDIGLVDVNACIADAVDAGTAAAAEKGIEVTAELDRSLPRVLGDALRVTQVLQNLVDNAIKFTPRSGKITLAARAMDDGMAHIGVSDSGCGISPELRGRLFERLQQDDSTSNGSRRGLGLGLWITRELVQSMNGSVAVDSEVGKGSTFTMTLPIYTIERLVHQVLGRVLPPALSLLRIDISHKLDQPPGCRGETARREALRCLQRCLVASTDVVVPESIGGDGHMSIFALVRADERGAEIIRQRIEAEFRDGANRLIRCGYEVGIHSETLALQPSDAASATRLIAFVEACLATAAG